MEWVETTAKTVEEAQERALDRLGIGRDEAEFEVLEEPKSGLFGLLRGEARIRARVRPEPVRPKNDRRRNGRKKKETADNGGGNGGGNESNRSSKKQPANDRSSGRKSSRGKGSGSAKKSPSKEQTMESNVSPEEVGAAAVAFIDGLLEAFDAEGSVTLHQDGTELEVTVDGDQLGLLVGPGGRTLTAIQDLARVSAQRRLGDHETRLRIDVGGYREKRRVALERFTNQVAQQVLDSGESKAMEPMSSADRKVVHDTVNGIEGVESRSDGSDPGRRVVISPA